VWQLRGIFRTQIRDLRRGLEGWFEEVRVDQGCVRGTLRLLLGVGIPGKGSCT